MKCFLSKRTNEKLDMMKKIIRMRAPYFEGKLIDSFIFHRNITNGKQTP